MADQVTSPADFGTDDAAIAQRWASEITIAERDVAEWFKRGDLIIKRYKDERPNRFSKARRFAMLWSNVQTLGPAIYAQTPQCVVSRRFKDADPVGRVVSEVLERATNYSLEEYDFDHRMTLVRNDYLLPGRGQVWVRYEPHFKSTRTPLTRVEQEVDEEGVQVTNDTSESYEDATGKIYEPDDVSMDDDGPHVMEDQLEYEEVCCDHVSWKDYIHSPAREWSEVRWVARRVYMSRAELKGRFGEVGSRVPLEMAPTSRNDEGSLHDEQFKRAIVYEIWDRPSQKVIWICKGYSAGPLDVREDPLGLQGFFPCPMPLYATLGPDTLIPTPDYVEYQDQAEEIDELTAQIGFLTDALRMNGFYDASLKGEVQSLFKQGNNNKLIPIAGWQNFKEGGGSRGAIEWVPIDIVAAALKSAFETRAQIVQDIYQITGISDVVRGDTDPNETATAQGLKAQWGSLRVRDRQKDMARFARDTIRIKSEIIAEKFSPETLAKMTGVDLFSTAAEKQQAEMQAEMMAAQQQPVPTALTEKIGRPTWEDVMGVLRDQAMRSFRVEIETDSTIEPDQQIEKQSAIEFVTAIGTLLGNALPAVQMAPALGLLVGESVKFVTRRFRIGREMEEVIDRVMDEIGKMPPPTPEGQAPQGDPNAPEVAQLELQTEQVKQQGSLQKAQMDAQMQQPKLQLDYAKLQTQRELAMRDPTPQVIANG